MDSELLNLSHFLSSMDLRCSVCNHHIPKHFVNRTKGLAYCSSCDNYLYLRDYLKRNPEQSKVESRYRTIRKPKNCMMEVAEQGEAHIITIPGDKQRHPWRTIGTTVLVLFCWWGFTVFCLYKIVVEQQEGWTTENLIFGPTFILAGFVMLYFFMDDYHEAVLTFTKKHITRTRKKIFGYTSTRSRNMQDLDTAREFYSSDSEGGSSYGVRLYFEKDYNLEVAQDVKEKANREWLAGQILQVRDKLTLAEEVREDVDKKLALAYRNPPIKRALKDSAAPMNMKHSPDKTTFTVPKERMKQEAIIQLVATMVGVVMFGYLGLLLLGFFGPFKMMPIGKYVFSFVVLVTCFAFFMVFWSYVYRAESQVEINKDVIKIHKKPFGFSINTVRQTDALTSIERDKWSKHINLHFSEGSSVRLGFFLDEKDIKWLIGEIRWAQERLAATDF